jgi:hypothetical protein
LIHGAVVEWQKAIDTAIAVRTQESVRKMNQKSKAYDAAVLKASNRYHDLVNEADGFFPDSYDDIYINALSARHHFHERRIDSTIGDILRGGIFLVRNSSDKKKGPRSRSVPTLFCTSRGDETD